MGGTPMLDRLPPIRHGTRILFVWPNTRISVWDVANGYRAAIGRAVGESNVRDYRLDLWSEYHFRAMIADPSHPKGEQPDKVGIALRSSQAIVNEVYYHRADLVFVVSGFGVHPVVAWNLHQMGTPMVTILTESPYDDDNQADWCTSNPDMVVLTTDLASARQHGWAYLPHSYDPAVHFPREPPVVDKCDVLIVGTGWKDRQAILEQVDWAGVDLRLHGYWPDITPDSPLAPFHRPGFVPNVKVAEMYAGARIVLNIHRHHPRAYSLNPRIYEVAACGSFQITDWRTELASVFGDAIPSFASPTQLEGMIRWFLSNPTDRAHRADRAMQMVRPCTFDNRLRSLGGGAAGVQVRAGMGVTNV